jgi:hypothetical protein
MRISFLFIKKYYFEIKAGYFVLFKVSRFPEILNLAKHNTSSYIYMLVYVFLNILLFLVQRIRK